MDEIYQKLAKVLDTLPSGFPSTCPTEAIQLMRKGPDEIVMPVKDEEAWFEERARQRGVDYHLYR
jgi:hypothetical protein